MPGQPPTRDRRRLGDEAERFVAAALEARGCRVLDRNPNFRVGELDLVLRDGDTVVFCEVRRRRPGRYGCGAQSVTRRKRRRIALAARAWLAGHRRFADAPCRFDVAAVSEHAGGLAVVFWQGAFTLDDL